MGIPGGWELILIVGVVLLLFGGKKIPELAKGLGKGIKDFKQAVNEDDEPVVEKAKEIEAKAEKTVDEVKASVNETTKA
jgi:sec-independent protein translocase protein TatA